ncbi:MAG: transglutaminase domain-containing protein, partial [Planctomycetota bacterium]
IALDDRVVPNYSGDLLPANSLEVQFNRFVVERSEGKQVDLKIEQYITAYKARVDEKRAQQIGWPSRWPSEVQSALAPTWFVQSTNEHTAKLAEHWTKGNPQAMTPYMLAKYLAKQVVGYYQPEGRSLVHDNHTKLTGVRVQGSDHAAKNRRGSWHDLVTLYVGVLRASGIPARPVIGIDRREGENEEALVSWAEFYLPTAGWVSVDMRRLKESPGMTHTLERPWEGFGTNDRLNDMVPLAHHFHPPYNVQAEGREKYQASKRNQWPLLWGWIPVPDPIPTDQQLSILVMDAPQRGDTNRGRRGRR